MQVSVVWRLREEFKAIFRCNSWSDATQYVQLWPNNVTETGVKEIMDVAEMFERHLTGVCNALFHEQSNGVPRKCMEVSQ